VFGKPVDEGYEALPIVVGDQLAVAGERLLLGDVDGVEQLAVGVEL
jgi:hypothetical protein